MEPGGSMPHSQGLSNNRYPEPNEPNSFYLIPISLKSLLILSSHLLPGLPESHFPAGAAYCISDIGVRTFRLTALAKPGLQVLEVNQTMYSYFPLQLYCCTDLQANAL